ncbi:MAG: hypothetical protein JWM16_4111, partial [Verrucomicrobiales bacterium]|nr:hypothetical protein [Verrucomicrobiales bacterium]
MRLAAIPAASAPMASLFAFLHDVGSLVRMLSRIHIGLVLSCFSVLSLLTACHT